MAEPNWNPCVHSVHPRLVYLPPAVKTGEPISGVQPDSSERILAAERSNNRRTLGARAARLGADVVSTIPRNFNRMRAPGVFMPPSRQARWIPQMNRRVCRRAFTSVYSLALPPARKPFAG